MTRRRPIRHWTAAAGLALVSVLAGACASVDTSNLDPVKVPDVTTTTGAPATTAAPAAIAAFLNSVARPSP